MVKTLFLSSIFLVSLQLLSYKSPVKFISSLILLAARLTILCILVRATSWMGRIFFMIFIGGIMVIFIILSSLLPNEKRTKVKKFALVLSFLGILVVLLSADLIGVGAESAFNYQTKSFFGSSGSFEILILLILAYFFNFIFLISKQNSSLRTLFCQFSKDFVNLWKDVAHLFKKLYRKRLYSIIG